MNISIKTAVDLGTVTFTLGAQTGQAELGGSYNIQMFLRRDSDGNYVQVSPRDAQSTPLAFNVADGGIPSSLAFPWKLDVGHYSLARVILFVAGTNFSQVAADIDNLPVDITVASTAARVVAPVLEITGPPSLFAAGASSFSVSAAQVWDWRANAITDPADKRALQVPNSTNRIAPVWFQEKPGSITLSFEINDGSRRLVSLYLLNGNGNLGERVELLDDLGGVVVSKDVPAFEQGVWLSWIVSGKHALRVVSDKSGPIVSGIFFDPAGASTPPIDTTTQGDWIGRYGRDGYFLPNGLKSVPSYLQGNAVADGNYHVPFRVKAPQGFHPGDGGFWTMAKGDNVNGGSPIFQQKWVQLETGHAAEGYTSLAQIAAGPDPYQYIDGEFTFPVPKSGVYNVQYGLFASSWGPAYTWVWPGNTFEIGGDAWVQKADPATFPALKAGIRTFGKFDFGNFGNSLYTLWDRAGNNGWSRVPANINAAYFAGLRLRAGTRCLRVVFGADEYLASEFYRHSIDNCVQQMLMGGVVPYLEPQIPPKNGADGLSALWKMLAAQYKGTPMLYGICNEPSGYPDWKVWKAVLARIAGEIRAVQPDAFLVGSLEGWSKDARAASADPLPAGTIDVYALHAYESAGELAAQIGHGIPVWVQEFIDDSEEFFAVIAGAAHVVGISSWTFNTLGDDALPLVAGASPVTFTARGVHYLDCMARARTGAFTPAPVTAPAPQPGPAPSPAPVPVPAPAVQPYDDSALLRRLDMLEASVTGLTTRVEKDEIMFTPALPTVPVIVPPVLPEPPPPAIVPSGNLIIRSAIYRQKNAPSVSRDFTVQFVAHMSRYAEWYVYHDTKPNLEDINGQTWQNGYLPGEVKEVVVTYTRDGVLQPVLVLDQLARVVIP